MEREKKGRAITREGGKERVKGRGRGGNGRERREMKKK